MNALHRTIVVFLAIVAGVCAAQQDDSAETGLHVFEGPVARETRALRFPTRAASLGYEGWVDLQFMVSPEGVPYEIFVADNIGQDSFIDAAIRHLEQTEFEPARVGAELVTGSSQMRYTFALESGADFARPRFGFRYREFIEMLPDATEVEAADYLDRLEEAEVRNIYEYAYLNLARYYFARQFGNGTEQMEYLQRALTAKKTERNRYESYLGEDGFRALRILFQLQVQNRYLAEALETYRILQSIGDEAAEELFEETAEQLQSLRDTGGPYGVSGEIEPKGSWDIKLFRNQFIFNEVAGTVDELKLRCQRSFVIFSFDAKLRYNVSDSAGRCWLQVIGEPGTTFTLVQQ